MKKNWCGLQKSNDWRTQTYSHIQKEPRHGDKEWWSEDVLLWVVASACALSLTTAPSSDGKSYNVLESNVTSWSSHTAKVCGLLLTQMRETLVVPHRVISSFCLERHSQQMIQNNPTRLISPKQTLAVWSLHTRRTIIFICSAILHDQVQNCVFLFFSFGPVFYIGYGLAYFFPSAICIAYSLWEYESLIEHMDLCSILKGWNHSKRIWYFRLLKFKAFALIAALHTLGISSKSFTGLSLEKVFNRSVKLKTLMTTTKVLWQNVKSVKSSNQCNGK